MELARSLQKGLLHCLTGPERDVLAARVSRTLTLSNIAMPPAAHVEEGSPRGTPTHWPDPVSLCTERGVVQTGRCVK